ncbi:MAG: universal stress protein [Betaproteobacteria bacterium]|nr:MAG: universal stress protein [Betaproteobacteria bacterium]
MYRHILVPTDGSRLSVKAIKTAVALASSLDARLMGVYVIPPYVPPVYGEAVIYVPEVTPKRYKEITQAEAKKALATVEAEAKAAGIACKAVAVTADQAWDGIVRTAHSKGCDLIVMASHGRRGLSGLLLGSETTKVLTHSKTPVLVCR